METASSLRCVARTGPTCSNGKEDGLAELKYSILQTREFQGSSPITSVDSGRYVAGCRFVVDEMFRP